MDNNKNSKNKKKVEPSFANDQLGENEIDKDMADKYREVNSKKKKNK